MSYVTPAMIAWLNDKNAFMEEYISLTPTWKSPRIILNQQYISHH